MKGAYLRRKIGELPVDVAALCIRRTRLGVGVTITVAPRTCSSSESKLNKIDVMSVPIMRCKDDR